MITYLLHTTSIWAVLYIAYKVLLSKEKYFMLNRVYLLASLALGLLLPLLQFVSLTSQQVIPEVSAVYHQQVSYISELSTSVRSSGVEATSIDWAAILFFLVSIGMAAMLIRNIIAGFKINDLYRQSEKLRHPEFVEVRTQKEHLPFSFFKYIFFSAFKLNDADRVAILNHEIHHVRAKHTWDVLFVEVIKVLFWWNPLVYLYKKAITENHEYAADHAVITQGSRKDYCTLLLQSNMPGVNLDLGHPFFQTYIKKRIDMMYRKNSTWKSYLKFTLPVIAIVFMAFVIQEDELILNYQLDSEYIDLFVGEDLLIPDVDYSIDHENKKVIITNSDYINVEGLSTCMYARYETKSGSLPNSQVIDKTADNFEIRIEEKGILYLRGDVISLEELSKKLEIRKNAQSNRPMIELSVNPEVKSKYVLEVLDLCSTLGLQALLKTDEGLESKIPSISPIAPKDILNKQDKNTRYGITMHPVHKVNKFHKGIDLIAKGGTPIFATADGIVSQAMSKSNGYGNHVIISHDDDLSTLFAHMESYLVKEGDKIERGDQIGFVGSTGTSTKPHLHYEVRLNGKAVNPIDYGITLNQISAKQNEKERSIEMIKNGFEKIVDYNFNRSDSQTIVDDKIELGIEVKGEIIVKTNDVILVENKDYRLNRETGSLTIIDLKLMKDEKSIQVEFSTKEMDKIIYARKQSLEVDKKVSSDMTYDSNCRPSSDGVHY